MRRLSGASDPERAHAIDTIRAAIVEAKSALEASLSVCGHTIRMCQATEFSDEERASSNTIAEIEKRVRSASKAIASILDAPTAASDRADTPPSTSTGDKTS